MRSAKVRAPLAAKTTRIRRVWQPKPVAALAARHRLLSIGPLKLPTSGGLFGYEVKFSDFFRRAASFVDKILEGTKPGDIPIEQAAKFKSIANLKTAKMLGINMPTSILLRADEVVE